MILNRFAFLLIFLIQIECQVSSSPVIGIVTLHTSSQHHLPKHSTYMYNSYEKFLEDNEMRWLPISMFEKPINIRAKLDLVNGVLLTGGTEKMGTKEHPSRYSNVIQEILKYSSEQQQKGKSFPVFGICMGFEGLLINLSEFEIELKKVYNDNHSQSIKLTPETSDFNSFNEVFSEKDKAIMNVEKIFYFHHNDGVLFEDLKKSQVANEYIDVLATSIAPNGEEIVVMFKHKVLPIIAVQFHPEKIQFEFNEEAQINKTQVAKDINSKFSYLFRTMVGDIKAKITNDDLLTLKKVGHYQIGYGKSDEAYILPPEGCPLSLIENKPTKNEQEPDDETG